jgi:pimeloyl-ACP methyl ester carboxylesterase
VVIHSYRHRYALVAGDPAYADIEAKLAAQPAICVPTIAIDGDSDGVNPGTAHHARKFEAFFERRVFAGAGHNLPQERPAEWAQAVVDVRKASTSQSA